MGIDIDTMRGMLGMWESMVDRLGDDAAADVLVALNPDPDVIEEMAGRAEQLAEDAGNEFRPTKEEILDGWVDRLETVQARIIVKRAAAEVEQLTEVEVFAANRSGVRVRILCDRAGVYQLWPERDVHRFAEHQDEPQWARVPVEQLGRTGRWSLGITDWDEAMVRASVALQTLIALAQR